MAVERFRSGHKYIVRFQRSRKNGREREMVVSDMSHKSTHTHSHTHTLTHSHTLTHTHSHTHSHSVLVALHRDSSAADQLRAAISVELLDYICQGSSVSPWSLSLHYCLD